MQLVGLQSPEDLYKRSKGGMRFYLSPNLGPGGCLTQFRGGKLGELLLRPQ